MLFRQKKTYLSIPTYISYFSLRSSTKLSSPVRCPSSPYTTGSSSNCLLSPNELDYDGNSYSHSTSILNTSFNFNNKLLSDDISNDNHALLSADDLQSSSKNGKMSNY